ncbi:MAG: Msa family membrane protein [Lachnospiraceae bacterium]|nr:Msa family membrane protein [Lachnospiraceae bacterium]
MSVIHAVIFSLVFNAAAYGLLLIRLAHASALEFLALALLLPMLFNSFLYVRGCRGNREWVCIVLLSLFMTVGYFAFGLAAGAMGSAEAFAVNNTFQSDTVSIDVGENISSLSNVIVVFLAQFCTMTVLRFILKKRGKRL